MTAPNGDPVTPMLEAAASIHELFLAYLEAGFTEQQALYLCGQMMRETMNRPPQDGGSA